MPEARVCFAVGFFAAPFVAVAPDAFVFADAVFAPAAFVAGVVFAAAVFADPAFGFVARFVAGFAFGAVADFGPRA